MVRDDLVIASDYVMRFRDDTTIKHDSPLDYMMILIRACEDGMNILKME